MAFLNVTQGNGSLACGGFLVEEDFVLTAAHCYKPGEAICVTLSCVSFSPFSALLVFSHIEVLLGAHDITDPESTQQHFSVLRYFPHPHFNQLTFSNDIMLLQLDGKANLTHAVRPITLPATNSTSHVTLGSFCNVAGWGRADIYNHSATHRLQEVDLEVINRDICRLYYPGLEAGLSILCVGDPGKKQGSFGGDSGGPLVCHGVVEGIVSYGKIRGVPPSVFTRISPYLPWITDTMKTVAA
ncbi:mast cell protease 1A-like [Microcaecilia unicolor]|uniref:Mast cell protease 1A-like n=1 Tax=Microcaecilia unicolor TaxID=1415580 RepID=A0A6P7WQ66_9AMPH|nr:mast cell protease 1A-like [Microcaecilia unicolor]